MKLLVKLLYKLKIEGLKLLLVGNGPENKSIKDFITQNIEGQKLYRILSNHITINYGSKRENSSSS